MATGDQNDFTRRLWELLPPWFGDRTSAPVVNALVLGAAGCLAFAYSLWAYADLQTRIRTATDGWLDLIAWDWFGPMLQRRPSQSDASYRALILASLIRERATRAALKKVLEDATGRTPVIFEPNRPLDTGAYSQIGGYGVAGGYSSLSLAPNTMLVIAFRPLIGTLQYGATDADIFQAINTVRPVGIVIGVQIQN